MAKESKTDTGLIAADLFEECVVISGIDWDGRVCSPLQARLNDRIIKRKGMGFRFRRFMVFVGANFFFADVHCVEDGSPNARSRPWHFHDRLRGNSSLTFLKGFVVS